MARYGIILRSSHAFIHLRLSDEPPVQMEVEQGKAAALACTVVRCVVEFGGAAAAVSSVLHREAVTYSSFCFMHI